MSFSLLVDGKRRWSEEGLALLTQILKDYHQPTNIRAYRDLHSFLSPTLTDVGFKRDIGEHDDVCAHWVLQTQDWKATVYIEWSNMMQCILLRINGELRPLRDLLPLWGILRESFINS